MKISAINNSVPVYRKKNQSDTNKSSNPIGQNNKPYSPGFGFDPVTTLAFVGYAVLYTAIYGGAVVKTNYDEMKSKLKEKELDEARQKKLNEISNSYKISIKDAEMYHDEFLEKASIPIKGNGDERGLNAVMGYEFEKYKLAMDIVAPTVIAQKKGYFTGSKPPSGVILYGPPGGGKTYIADKLCDHLDYFNVNIVEIDFDINDHKGNVNKIVDAFTAAEENYKENRTYTLIRLPDDIDNFMVDRNSERAEFNAETTALIKYAENCSDRGAIWMSTANNPRKIDKAVLRPGRTDVKLAIGNMEDYTTANMIKYSLYKYGESEIADSFDYKKVIDTMQEKEYLHTPYELEYFVSLAKKHNMEPGRHVNADMVIAEMVDYNENDFPTLDESAIAKFLDDQTYMETKEPDGADL